MERHDIGRNLKTMRIYLAVFLAAAFSLSSFSQTQPLAKPVSTQTAAPAPRPVSPLLQPALDTVGRTLDGVKIDKWKKGSIRDEASANIDSIRNDLRTNIPPLLQQADAGSGNVSKLLPVSSHIAALYDVLLRVSEASRISGPDDQAAQLQDALLGLSKARLSLNDRIQASADGLEKQVADLRTTVQQQAAQRAAAPAPVALPCIPPPAKKPAARSRKPAAGTAAKPANPTTTPAKPSLPK